jgi:aspartate-semialdehyde dehydrogenase
MEQRGFKVSNIKLYASEKSSGKIVSSKVYGNLPLEPFTFESAKSLDVVFLAVGGDFSLEWAEKLASNGVLVIDNSSAFRYKDDVPLVIPEINIKAAKGKKLIANPNCTTAIALMALWPIHQRFKIKKAIISTYQAASGAGAAGMQELKDGMQKACNGEAVVNQVFAHPLPYNIIPQVLTHSPTHLLTHSPNHLLTHSQIDVFQDNAYTKEEMKVAWESRKIMELPNLKVSCTAVRIPTLRAHSEAITLETELPITANEVRKILSNAPGVDLIDEPSNKKYPMPLTATKKYNIEVGRIR